MNVVELLVDSSNRLPNQPVLHFMNQSFTYKELLNKICQTASGLESLGVKDGSHVGLMMGNRPEYVISYFAILSVGGIVVPINPLFKEKETAYILNDSEAEFLIFEELCLPVVQAIATDLSHVNEIIMLGSTQHDYIPWVDLLTYSSLKEPAKKSPLDTAQIIYTSGTTGFPKGAMITHSNLNWMSITAAIYNGIRPGDKIMCVLPLFHAYAKLQGLLAPIVHGGTIYLESRFEPDSILEKLDQFKINVFLGVPTMYTMFVQSPKFADYDLSSLRIAGSGGASLPKEIIEKVNAKGQLEISEGYGLTESTVMLSSSPIGGVKKVGSVGLPLPGVDIKVVDPEGKEVPVKMTGEVIFRGPNMMKGYYKKPEETENTIKDGWLYTGDLAYRDEDGYIFIVDRKKDMIIRGGYNIYPREVEEVLYSHPDIIECAVIGRPDPLFGEKTVAYLVSKTIKDTEIFSAYCKEQLVHYKNPDYFIFLEELPKSSTGKILKTVLKKQEKQSIQQER